ncbi:alpha/beta hydrolase [Chromobacterium sphagni]|uniref:Alpha/beta hydrolase fold-3 domain-containing protein n=1 Tax=Chromobacterium sphagni TaxID=1903179 RepID=A0ABX3CIA9_9NEIS|nr:alpha/beta hydrolase [Chromobacterium sphagni]OHX21891.1 hypothetical protein BI344_05145 [Chromobacterium sphagni]
MSGVVAALLLRLERASARRALGLPALWLALLAGRPRRVDGAPLNRQLQLMLRLRWLSGKRSWHRMGVAAARRQLEREGGLLAQDVPASVSHRDIELDGSAGPIHARLYRPAGLALPAPTLVFYHGGGFVAGSLDSHDLPCRALAAATPCQVVSIDYRLAPEHPFPAAVDDAVDALRAVAANCARWDVDPARLAVGGDSAGGNLATVAALATRSDPVRPCFQILWYPVVDSTASFPSVQRFARGFYLDWPTMRWCLGHYTGGGQLRHPQVSPIFADLAGAPPAYIQTAGFDPLRDEGEAYADRLAAAGGVAQHRRYPGLIHGFFNLAGCVDEAGAAFDDAAAALRQALYRPMPGMVGLKSGEQLEPA